MIVCSCNVLTRNRVLAAAEALARQDAGRPVTPGRLFRALGARPQCGTCFATVRKIVANAGITFTCPEPLASVAERREMAEITETEITVVEVEVVFDATGKVA